MLAATVPELFGASFAALGECVPFDVAAAVMIEQNLDLHVVTRNGAEMSEPLIERIRTRLRAMIPISAEIVAASETPLPAPRGEGGAQRRVRASIQQDLDAMLQMENRTPGLLLLFSDDPFDETVGQRLAICAA